MANKAIYPPEFCHYQHDNFAAWLTLGLCIGLVLSYLPQHYKIIHSGTSEGLNPLYLLLGSTSAASGMLNVITLQWVIIACCKYLNPGQCIESLGAVWIVGLQWFFFTTILVLYLVYFPPHRKYVDITSHTVPWDHSMVTRQNVPSTEWRLASIAGITTLVHFLFITFVTFFLILTEHSATTPSKPYPIPSPDPNPPPSYPAPYPTQRILLWATFLGLLSTVLAVVQYAPQLWTTWKAKTVGALSIPMMCIQTPGAILMVTSIAIRPGTNWTSWITYATAGVMQGSLLVMCICWKVRQKRLDIDDFGRPLHTQLIDGVHRTANTVTNAVNAPVATISNAVHAAATAAQENTPLLGGQSSRGSTNTDKKNWYTFWKK
ncbi:hypothetical protein M408DRAFT_23915 [Serendipita vermifera MAFF 305830]|uniref:Uncharacterized protein n=1 Tax=Serendipita vermifera MAFF 305830 TaxID=933852 RepID=A0A0C3B7W4_SERVB|nr:hypothetical protein M408DRAFT_23915 [Serendipita vermifera MAFF 305830]